jgi:hypothetical protein
MDQLFGYGGSAVDGKWTTTHIMAGYMLITKVCWICLVHSSQSHGLVDSVGGEGQVSDPNNTRTDVRPEDAKCLIYFLGNLDDTSNQIVFKDLNTCNFQLHSIDVLQIAESERCVTTGLTPL